MRVLAIDPATRTGVAIVEYEEGMFGVPQAFVLEVSTHHPDVDVDYIKHVRATIRSAAADWIVLEGQYFSRNARVLMRLTQIRAWWEAAAVLAGLPVESILPTQWRRLVYADYQRADRKTIKERARQRCKQLFGYTPPADADEAALIGVASILRHQHEDQISRQKKRW